MSLNVPIRFHPLFRQYIWGGRRLGDVLGKPIAKDGVFAESWEISDHGDDQSVVTDGVFAGKTLQKLVEECNAELFGRHAGLTQFPLLLKFLDANRNLSVQVHPNDQQAAKLNPPDAGKTEAWVVLHAEPGAKVYAGLKRGFDRQALEREVNRGTTELCLHSFEPQVGDCIFIPAGTIHAIGAGLLIYEIQQSSDTTFRLFDWNRVGDDGQPRPLHIEQALAVTDFDRGPIKPQSVNPNDAIQTLVDSDKFVLQRRWIESQATIGGDDRFHILAVVEGEVVIGGEPLKPGCVTLVPAAATAEVQGRGILLDAFLP